MVDPDYTEE